MQIQNEDPNTSKLGEEYESSGDGVFIVPDELGEQLIKFPHWRIYDGNPWPHEKTPQELEAERIASIVQQAVQALPPTPAPKPAKASESAKAPAKKKAAKKKTGSKSAKPAKAPAKVEIAPAAAAKSDVAGDAKS